MKKVLCFGELLLRLPPAQNGAWLQQNSMPVFVAGAELNVATALATWHMPVSYCTALPDNIITTDILNWLQPRGIDTTSVQFSGERIGLYYLKEGADMKSAENVFDRKYSSFSQLQPGSIDWDAVLQQIDWLHLSAIPPAVSESAAAVCLEAVQAAAAKNIPVSFDLNYRSQLWKYGRSAADVLADLLPYCTLIMGNIWSAHSLLGAPLQEQMLQQRKVADYAAHARQTSTFIFEKYRACRWVAQTFRFDTTDGGLHYFGTLDEREGQRISAQLKAHSVVEKVGSGDCFMAGLIYGIRNRWGTQQIIDYAAAAAMGKLQEKGDATRNSVQDVHGVLDKYRMQEGIA
ncbi:MAG TPA: sugar kinase [Lacibacter sp.]|nr:sugar kinase [Lacibacter sp.]HMO89194.1 sugar kinase [Lacibacter sp.]HMP86146.1 sugar kinase [Lacibacter sp.]